MDSFTFYSKLVEFLAWPSALALIAIFLRKEIKGLLPLITKVKAGPLEVEMARLEKKVQAVEEKTDVVIDKMGMNEGDDPSANPPSVAEPESQPPASPPDAQSADFTPQPQPPRPGGDEPLGNSAVSDRELPTGNRVSDSPAARLAILRALDHSEFAMRSLSGIAVDTGIHAAAVRAILRMLMDQGLVSETINSTGKVRYFLTPTGAQTLMLTRVNLPITRPGKIGEM